MRVGLPAWRLLSPKGGVGNTLWHLLAQYRELAPADEFLVYHEGDAPDLPPGDNLVPRRLNVPAVENNLTWNDLALPLAVRRDRVELVHNLSYTLPARLNVPAVVTVHDVSYRRHPEGFPPRARAFLHAGTLRAVKRARVVTDSLFSAAEIQELYGLPRERIDVVPLAAEPRFRVLDDTGAVRAAYHLPDRFVLYLGGILARRRLDRLIVACGRVLERCDAYLVIAGPTVSDELDAAALAAAEGIGDRVLRLGFVPDELLPELYNAATCFAWPSIYEGFGLPPLEAIACGTPAIVADASSLPEVVGDAGLLVPPDDVDALATAVEALLTDDVLRARLSRLGPEQAAKFSWRATAERMLAIYREVLA